MARRYTSGFELNSLTAGVEFDIVATTIASVQNTIKRSGEYALKILGNGSANASYQSGRFISVTGWGTMYFRTYFYLHTSANANVLIFLAEQASGARLGFRLDTNDTIQFRGGASGFANIGSPSPALSKDEWHRLEMSFTYATGACSARVDGVEFASGAITASQGLDRITVGAYSNISTGEFYFDDLAVNTDEGSYQNTWCGEGKVIHIHPNATGDSNSFLKQAGGAGDADNYQSVDEVTPDDATTFLRSKTLNAEDLYNCGASGIGSIDTVNVVQVGVRYRGESSSSNSGAKIEIEKTGSGTKTQSTEKAPANTTWLTNAWVSATYLFPGVYPIISYLDPDGAAWTQTTLDSMQIGIIVSTGSTKYFDISTAWALIEYVEVPITTNIKTINGLAKAQIKTINGLSIASVKSFNGLE